MGDEFERITELRRRFRAAGAGLVVGIGDDAAVLAQRPGMLTASVDSCVQDVHFRHGWLSLQQLGFRAVTAALSDLAAMGAAPSAVLCALVLPEDFEDDALWQLADGLAEAAAAHGTPIAGGNLSAGEQLSIHTTVLGHCDGPIRRDGAAVGDTLYLTGSVGGAALGLQALQLDRATEAEPFVVRWRRPRARIDMGLRLRGVASAAIDLSDGLLQDLGHLCDASGVGAELDYNALPLQQDFESSCARLALDPRRTALGGGEDYELLFASARPLPPDLAASAIGRLVEEGIVVLDGAGGQIDTAGLGFRHFVR